MTSVDTRTRVCAGCGSTNVGAQGACARCATPLGPTPRRARTKRFHWRRALAIATVLPSLAGVGYTVWQLTHHDSHATTTTAPLPRATSASTAQSCASARNGYTAHYPAGWVTESATAAQACHFFGARPFRVATDTVAAGDVSIDTSIPETYDAVVASFAEQGDAATKLYHTALTINGHRAQQMNYRTTQGGQRQYAYGYLIDHNGKPLVIATKTLTARSPELQRDVTAMARSLELR